MDETLPAKPDEVDKPGGETRILAIGHLHYHGNDLAELRKIAENNPALAERIIEQADKVDQRANVSYRFGLASSIALVLGSLGCLTFLVVSAGVLPTIGFAGVFLAIAVLIRVILTGEWSDTSWFGKLVSALARALGGKADD